MKRKRVDDFDRKTKKRKKNSCALVTCNHERCHHFRFIKFLKTQRDTFTKDRKKKWPGMYFYASLMPYQRVFEHSKFGVRSGEADFYISAAYKCPKKKKRFIALAIELKGYGGKLTEAEKKILRETDAQGDVLVGVCFGWKACKKLALAYKRNVKLSKLKKLCWCGEIKRNTFL